MTICCYADSVCTQQMPQSLYICKLNLTRPTIECNYTRLASVPASSCRYQITTYLDCQLRMSLNSSNYMSTQFVSPMANNGLPTSSQLAVAICSDNDVAALTIQTKNSQYSQSTLVCGFKMSLYYSKVFTFKHSLNRAIYSFPSEKEYAEIRFTSIANMQLYI